CPGTPSVATFTRRRSRSAAALLRFASKLLAITLSRQRLLRAAFIARLQVEGVLLDILDDVFLLHLPLEPSESALDRFALLNLDFSHPVPHPPYSGCFRALRAPVMSCPPKRLSR